MMLTPSPVPKLQPWLLLPHFPSPPIPKQWVGEAAITSGTCRLKGKKIDSKLPMAHLLLTVSQSKSCFPTASWLSHLCEFMTRFLMCSTLLLFSPQSLIASVSHLGAEKLTEAAQFPPATDPIYTAVNYVLQ